MDVIISSDGGITVTKYNPMYYGVEWIPLFDHTKRRCKSKMFGEYRMYRLPDQLAESTRVKHTDLERLRKTFDFFFGIHFLKNPKYPVKIHFTGKPAKNDHFLFHLISCLLKFQEKKDDFWRVVIEYRLDLWDRTALLKYEPRNELSHDVLNQNIAKKKSVSDPITIPVPTPDNTPLHLLPFDETDPELNELLQTIGEQLEETNNSSPRSPGLDPFLSTTDGDMFYPVYNMFDTDNVFGQNLFL